MVSCVDAGLWHVCAGNMVQVPLVNSKVVYFPQGHAEHANGAVNFEDYPEIPTMVNCRVVGVKYMADVETDEVYLRMRFVPLRMNAVSLVRDEDDLVGYVRKDGQEKSSSFSKTLTQSDANNGGGFSVPKYCAESLFPALDYTADPPVQTLRIKDVHGMVWKFRHIFRGTPRRHLLTTGWSNYVNHKRLVAGDSVVFFRAANGEIFVGIRRAKRGFGRMKPQCGWTPAGGNWDSRHVGYNMYENGSSGSPWINGKVTAESVVETALLAAAGKAFEVDYYPRAGSAEFFVTASAVKAALRTQWCAGMKFKMAFETKDASKVSWFHGTIQAALAADPVRWPDSPWRLLQVNWDEPDLLRNVDRVSPWSVDIIVSCMPVHVVPPSLPPLKRLRLPQTPDLPSSSQHPAPSYPDPFITNLSYYPVADNVPTGIQGARHIQFGQYPLNLHLNNTRHPRPFPEFRQPFAPPPPAPVGVNFSSHHRNQDLMSLMRITNRLAISEKNEEAAATGFVLFGQHIVMEEKMSQSSSAVSNSLSHGNMEKVENGAGSSGSGSVQNAQKRNSPDTDSPCSHSSPSTEMGPQTFAHSGPKTNKRGAITDKFTC